MVDKVYFENGLKLYLLPDNNKHTTYINLLVNFGGLTTNYIKNNKKSNLVGGTAHFLEHYLLECSKYGDLMTIFGSNGVGSNGLTMLDRTQYYIDTVKDPIKYLRLLIDGIHNPVFNKENIKRIKEPILAEKRRSMDNKHSCLFNRCIKNTINSSFDSILGSFEEIDAIDNKTLENAFKSFYRPNNEIIIISGKFNKEKVINEIKNIYDNIIFDNYDIETYVDKFKIKKTDKILFDTNIETISFTYKIDISKFSGFDKIKIDTYIFFMLKENFGIASKISRYLISNNIIIGNIRYGTYVFLDYLYIQIDADYIKEKDYTNCILDIFKNKKFTFNKKTFELNKKNYIVDIILRKDNIYMQTDPLIENIFVYGFEDIDSILNINKLNFREYKNIINNLCFDVYNATFLKKK